MTEAVFTFTTSSADETQSWGRDFASQLKRGDCIALIGELGSGKTCLTQGICEGLRVTDRVNSPTFILVNEYTGEHDDGKPLVVYHFDLYRLVGEEELADLGWEEAVAGDPALRLGLNVCDGKVTYEAVAMAHGLEYTALG